MALFQSSVLKDHLRLQEEQQVDKAYKKFTAFFHNPEIQENIRSSKEEQFQATFLSELFVKVLGYTMNPQPGYELTTEFRNQKNARKADGAILKDGLAIGVIELKGTNTKHLEGIRQQAFDYKANQKGCVYVVTSNFEKLRFYINDATEFIEFDLFELTLEDFSLLYLCLHKDNIFSNRPLKIKEASLVEEEVITKQFYKDYSVFKRELFRDLVLRNVDRIKKENPSERHPELVSGSNPEAETKKQIRLSLFKKSQKLIDRFLFIFFAEDRGLLPPNSIHRIIADWNKLKDLDAETPLYKRFQLYFSYLDTGRKGTDKKAEIFAYNGGLFKPDPILDTIEIDDDLLYKHTARLATYDFESQVDVNILGHIFENSLNEIESVHAEIEGADFDKQKSKRKKDGVFYTPKYITKYIVENTVGRLCEEKKSELGFREEEYFKGRKQRQTKTIKGLLKILDDYRDWLLKLTICDPACGSGAFLNQALDFLIKEHRYIDELKHKLLGGGLVFSDIETTILENNIYGVDINEESVEIAKLSLWLRTAQPRRKLNDLSSNIKCGNSLIDDPKVAGHKAFKWEEEFSDVFADGGFDVVIGNPPYGAQVSPIEKLFYKENYKITEYNYDTYNFFFELGINILKANKRLGYITPNTFLVTENGELLRNFLFRKNELEELYETFKVFPDAVVEPINIIVRKRTPDLEGTFKVLLKPRGKEEINEQTFNYQEIFNNDNLIFNYRAIENERDLFLKIIDSSRPLIEFAKVTTGIKPYQTGKGNPKQTKEILKSKPFTSYLKTDDSWFPLIRGTDINRYLIKWNGEFIKYGEWLAEPRNPDIFFRPKIFIRRTDDNLMCTYDSENFVGLNSIHCIQSTNPELNEKYLLAFTNSKLCNWFFRHQNFHMVDKPLAEIKVKFVERLPIMVSTSPDIFVQRVDEIIGLKSTHFNLIGKFSKYLEEDKGIKNFGRRLQSWYELPFGAFIKELNKAIKISNKDRAKEGLSPVPELTKKDEFEWMELFEENKKKALELQREIEKTDAEIDLMVYKLYGLTYEEVLIVDKEFKISQEQYLI